MKNIDNQFRYKEPPYAGVGVFVALFVWLLIGCGCVALILWVLVRLMETIT